MWAVELLGLVALGRVWPEVRGKLVSHARLLAGREQLTARK